VAWPAKARPLNAKLYVKEWMPLSQESPTWVPTAEVEALM
jgi:hypothetical protein